jgi:hypothetical protein
MIMIMFAMGKYIDLTRAPRALTKCKSPFPKFAFDGTCLLLFCPDALCEIHYFGI